jgi:hypothetical protein
LVPQRWRWHMLGRLDQVVIPDFNLLMPVIEELFIVIACEHQLWISA